MLLGVEVSQNMWDTTANGAHGEAHIDEVFGMVIIGKRRQLVEGQVRDPVCEEDGRIQKTVYGHGEDTGSLFCRGLRCWLLQDKVDTSIQERAPPGEFSYFRIEGNIWTGNSKGNDDRCECEQRQMGPKQGALTQVGGLEGEGQ